MPEDLNTQIARVLFGWEYRDDWQAWCPPGYPPLAPDSTSAERPAVPDYQQDPVATARVWQWLEQHAAWVELVSTPPTPADRGQWRCQVWRQRAGPAPTTVHHDQRGPALCLAALAYAQAHQEGPA
jgi:hypothetical protein